MDEKYRNYSNKPEERHEAPVVEKQPESPVEVKKAYPSLFVVYAEGKNNMTLSIRKQPSGKIIDAINMKEKVTVLSIHDGWARIIEENGHEAGYVLAKFLRRVEE